MKCRNIRITCRTDCRKQGERKDERMKRKDGKMKRWKDNRNPARRSGGFAIRSKGVCLSFYCCWGITNPPV